MDILEWPIFYNLRFLVAGKQELTRNYISRNFKKYKCKNVLDLGCGTGDFATIFSSKVYKGLDLNSKYIEFAKNQYSEYTFECADITRYDLNKKVDCLIFISTLHHLSDKEITKIFKSVVKMTRKIIIIVDLNPETSFIKKFLINMDRGNYVRTTKQKVDLLNNFGKILEVKHFSTGLASQSGLILKPIKRI